ncbi:hypothetical protein CU098_006420 [Rhizopus stolonifer]|uniref:BHLH domain-containing protein n=1 Tax=Rhizopus stolonifer TaxID=4846 RepID=A0A367JMI0_RHIST|nr:hypothetical protein CU098_006420 [Rhizopus stolonifer]
MSISERRASYPLQDRIKIYSPDSMAQKIQDLESPPTKLVLNGVNLLNKSSLDSDTAMNRIKQKKETHNRVERRRRENLKTLLSELSVLVPRSAKNGGAKCHRAKILRYAIDYIQTIEEENKKFRRQLVMPL